MSHQPAELPVVDVHETGGCACGEHDEAVPELDARTIPHAIRHAAIFGALDSLRAGETMRFVNDHDPLPLLDQISARYGEAVTINYIQRDPGAIAIDFLKI